MIFLPTVREYNCQNEPETNTLSHHCSRTATIQITVFSLYCSYTNRFAKTTDCVIAKNSHCQQSFVPITQEYIIQIQTRNDGDKHLGCLFFPYRLRQSQTLTKKFGIVLRLDLRKTNKGFNLVKISKHIGLENDTRSCQTKHNLSPK